MSTQERELRYSNLTTELMSVAPELEDELRTSLADVPSGGEPPPQHLIFGIVFGPRLVTVLKEDPSGTAAGAYLQFLERMAQSTDGMVRSVVSTVLLEQVMSGLSRRQLSAAIDRMGGATRAELSRLLGLDARQN